MITFPLRSRSKHTSSAHQDDNAMDTKAKMTTARKALIGVALLALGLRAGWDQDWGMALPLWSQEMRENHALRTRIQLHSENLQGIQKAEKKLSSAMLRSLSSDLPRAISTYQSLLVMAAEVSQIRNCTIRPGATTEEEGVGSRIPFTIHGIGGDAEVSRFIEALESLPILHRVTSIVIVPNNKETPSDLSLQVAVEALALHDADGIEPAEVTRSLNARPNDLTNALLTSRPFSRLTPKLNVIAVRSDAEVTQLPSATPVVQLIGIWSMGENSEAWFADSRGGQTQIVSSHSKLLIGDTHALVVAIHPDGVIVQINGRMQRLSLGESPKMAYAE
jgi:Tfp pilus assembly protein PilO